MADDDFAVETGVAGCVLVAHCGDGVDVVMVLLVVLVMLVMLVMLCGSGFVSMGQSDGG